VHSQGYLPSEHNTKLYRFYISEPQLRQSERATPVRHRGKSPQQPAFFTRSARARHESAAFASLCRLTGALPRASSADGVRDPAGLGRGELLCQAYEIYRARFSSPLLSFEHAVFLLGALWRSDELSLGACRDCNALLVTERWTLRAPRCIVCAPPARPAML
jgi:hypothetical protein